MKRLVSLLLAVAAVFLLTACGDRGAATASTPEELLELLAKYSSDDTWDRDAMYGLCYECTYCRQEDREKYQSFLNASLNDAQKKENEEIYGEHYTVTFQLTDTKTLVGDDRFDAVNRLSKSFDGTDRITELMYVTTTMTLSGSLRTEQSDNGFDFIRIDGKWFFSIGDQNPTE